MVHISENKRLGTPPKYWSSSKVIVFDIGSTTIRAGFSNELKPIAIVPSIIGKCRFKSINENNGKRELYIGYSAIRNIGILNIKYPISDNDIDGINKLISYTYNSMNLKDDKYNFILCLPSNMCLKTKLSIVDHFNNEFKVKSIILYNQSFTSWFNYKQDIGISVYCGNNDSNITLFKNNKYTHCKYNFPSGIDHTRYFSKLTLKGWNIKDIKRISRSLLENIKTEYCNFEPNDYQINIELPGGDNIIVHNEQYTSCEIFFDPRLDKLKCYSMDDAIINSINSETSNCNLKILLYSNIYLSGGVSKLNGIKKELESKIKYKLLLSGDNYLIPHVNVVISKELELSPWLGASKIINKNDID